MISEARAVTLRLWAARMSSIFLEVMMRGPGFLGLPLSPVDFEIIFVVCEAIAAMVSDSVVVALI